MIMKILPLTVHNPHQLGYIFGSDTLSLVAPKRRFDTCCVKPFFVELSPKRIFTFCKVQYIFTHKCKCCRNDTFFTYSVTLRWSVEIATTSISKIRPLFTADFFCGNCISDIKTDNYKIIVGNWYCLQTKRHPIVQRIFAKLESNTTQSGKTPHQGLINCHT